MRIAGLRPKILFSPWIGWPRSLTVPGDGAKAGVPGAGSIAGRSDVPAGGGADPGASGAGAGGAPFCVSMVPCAVAGPNHGPTSPAINKNASRKNASTRSSWEPCETTDDLPRQCARRRPSRSLVPQHPVGVVSEPNSPHDRSPGRGPTLMASSRWRLCRCRPSSSHRRVFVHDLPPTSSLFQAERRADPHVGAFTIRSCPCMCRNT